ncbi:hypothetical protein [Ideonella sp.]|uniref:hypothetical protein n=1 Tax=Ideonella sp. TaxID=1929293 RepID=UPI002B494796|nr:hypothetical protein [Ideonella sp.]HJV71332.1 hypothetical protein [Ideonella sp.]
MTPEGARAEDSLALCLADALQLRCVALEETLRLHAGPALMLALVVDIRRLAAELRSALDAEDALERIRHGAI